MYEAEDASVAALRRAVCDAIVCGALNTPVSKPSKQALSQQSGRLPNPLPLYNPPQRKPLSKRNPLPCKPLPLYAPTPRPPPSALSQPRSVWEADGSDESTNGPRGCARRLKSKLLLGCLAAAVLVIAGAVVGAVLGLRATRKTARARDTGALAHAASQLGAWSQTAADGTLDHAVAFQDTTGALVVVECHGNVSEAFALASRVPRLPSPLLGTPIRIQPFGEAPDLHVFYLDERRLIQHVVRAGDGRGAWILDDAFSTDGPGDGAQAYVADGRALAVMTTPAEAHEQHPAMAVLYWDEQKNNTLGLLRREAPFDQTRWTFQRVQLENGAKSMGSPGLLAGLALGTYEEMAANASTYVSAGNAVVATIRILWDADGVALETCVPSGTPYAQQCWSRAVTYSDEHLRDRVRDAPKPLQMAELVLDNEPDRRASVTGFLGGGRYWEAYWRDDNCTAAMDLHLADGLGDLAGFAFMQSRIVLALRNGTLVQLRRCPWWTGACGDEVFTVMGAMNTSLMS
ncbi:hypothetical protein JDV02_003886 [Purpureocillium takamizusanense]|uniref:Fucose-specific lectin n=1 Tax=Purpureocillium takamizusanense TaxID=2060973 RepID=A0A9Q8V9B3_9HYPO|nr:uncharacterized protein JDV02_003886 [Purpureocillium takamizusanense]UNI17553.1 hypothetical protein JDV02_003886 [Purpureocillium takamizusanense]